MKTLMMLETGVLIPESERSPGEGNGNPLQYSCLENRMDRAAWQTTVHGVARIGHNLATKPPSPHTHTKMTPSANETFLLKKRKN